MKEDEAKRLLANTLAINEALVDSTSSSTNMVAINQEGLNSLLNFIASKQATDLQKKDFSLLPNSEPTQTALIADLERKMREQQEELKRL